jgi:tetratricopeptide (TPR) repeat protein
MNRLSLARAWIALALLVAACLAAFWPVLSADWVLWDDDRNFTEHWAWRGLSGEHLVWMLTTFHMGHYQPLSWLTLAIDWSVWGLDARGFHATNLVLHAGTAAALWFAARRLLAIAMGLELRGGAAWLGATFAALVFAVHPLRVESVAWITERRDVLGGLFFVLGTGAWVRYASGAQGSRARWYAAALACTLLSLLSKASAIVLPALWLVIDVWPLGRWRSERRTALLDKLPFVAMSLAFGWLALRAQGAADSALAGVERHGLLERAVQAGFGSAFYLGKTIWPVELVPIREIPSSLMEVRYLAPASLALALTVLLVVWRRRVPALLVAWLAYALILAPTSGIAQAGPQLVADRYSYFACLPFALLAGAALVHLARRSAPAAHVVGAGCALALGIATNVQARVWQGTEALWTHALEVDPGAGIALHNLGAWHLVQSAQLADPALRRARVESARELYLRGARVAPSLKFEVGLGIVAGQLAELDPERRDEHLREALERIERGVRQGEAQGVVEPSWRFQLGAALLQAGRPAEAVRELEPVAQARPESPQPQRVLALAYAAQGLWSEAAQHVERALRVQPEEPLLWLRLGSYQAELGERDAARRSLERAIALSGGVAERAAIEAEARRRLGTLDGPR